MKTEYFNQLKAGDALRLKPERAAAYGLETQTVQFEAVCNRGGYKTPFIKATGGIYKPSDFK